MIRRLPGGRVALFAGGVKLGAPVPSWCWKMLKATSARPVAASNWKGGKTLTDAYSMFQNLHLIPFDAGCRSEVV